MRKIFKNYTKNKILLRDIEYNIILRSRQESLGVHSFAISDPTYTAVEAIEKKTNALRREITIVEETMKHFKDEIQHKMIILLFVKHLEPKVAMDLLALSKTSYYRVLSSIYEYAKKVGDTLA